MTSAKEDKFHWARRVARNDVKRLYESDAAGRLDEELLEKVSYGIYTRIKEFHMNQGIAGRPVGENVIQGTAQKVSELIASLACGPVTAEGRGDRQWAEIYNDPIRLFRRKHAYAEILELAAQLGIQGRSKMQEDVLVAEIYRLAPDLFVETKEDR